MNTLNSYANNFKVDGYIYFKKCLHPDYSLFDYEETVLLDYQVYTY